MGTTLAPVVYMSVARIQQLPDGEELISEGDDSATQSLVVDPRQELLEHRRGAEAALERAATLKLSTAKPEPAHPAQSPTMGSPRGSV